MSSSPALHPLGVAPFVFSDLFDPGRLAALTAAFEAEVAARDPELAAAWACPKSGEDGADPAAESDLLIRRAETLGPFVARLFGIGPACRALMRRLTRDETIVAFRREVVGKRLRPRQLAALPPTRPQQAVAYARLEDQLAGAVDGLDAELRAAHAGLELLALVRALAARPPPAAAAQQVAALAAACGLPAAPPAAQAEALWALAAAFHRDRMQDQRWTAHRQPEAVDPTHQALVPLARPDPGLPERLAGVGEPERRDGFALTDRGMGRRQVHGEVDYCLKCHPRGRDSCRTGLHDREQRLRRDPKGIELGGCPLDERISEAHLLRQRGEAIGALAMICLDNPMCAGTGHRICNDCMKACIFQKQTPVDIPQVETGILGEVLALPWGFEVYSLLTRWNPLSRRRPQPLPPSGRTALVVGLGPAGYTLAHYLLGEGIGVVAVDALKLEPLPAAWLGDADHPPTPIVRLAQLTESGDDRAPQGFGGVAEYGITARWDKNFLKILYLNLARRQQLAMFGGIRLGSTLTLDDAWQAGFDHVALCAGAGRPTVVPLRDNLLPGIRLASDFLMGLQLTGAGMHGSLANLQVELPALVVGGGLTAIDTASEVAAYYPRQVERLAAMVDRIGEAEATRGLSEGSRATFDRLLGHGREVQRGRRRPGFDPGRLVAAWGGVTVVYRRSLQEAPAYRLNHEEVRQALAEGITIAQRLTPQAALPDRHGHVDALQLARADGSLIRLPARSVMLAAGVSPNTIYEREVPGTFALDAQKRFFRPHHLAWREGEADLVPAAAATTAGAASAAGLGAARRRPQAGFFTSYRSGPFHRVSFFGDNHPHYAGSVVRAMASAKDGLAAVMTLFAGLPPVAPADRAAALPRLAERVGGRWRATVHAVRRLGPRVVEVAVHAPMQAERFQPGQFFRLQNFASGAPWQDGHLLAMEGLALTGAEVDRAAGVLTMVALESGVSSRLVAELAVGEQVVLMGPTGAATEIPAGETVLLCGGGLGNAVLMSVGAAMRARGSRTLLFAAYRTAADIFKRPCMEAAGDRVFWSVESGPLPDGLRPGDRAMAGRITDALAAYRDELAQVDRVVTIGSDRMMRAVHEARRGILAPVLRPDHQAVASVNSPMQCMMKELCAQCLQRHIDPATGEESFVFSCFNQDQPQDLIDWDHLHARLQQNAVVERVGSGWMDQAARPSPG